MKKHLLSIITLTVFTITAAFNNSPLSAQPVTQVFTTSGSFLVPPCVTSLKVETWGGGGGGGGGVSNPANDAGGGGGGGGYSVNAAVAVIPGNSYTVTVGLGGTASTGNAGGNGGASSFNGGMVIASGGTGGAIYNNFFSSGNGAGGAGGTGGAYSGGSGANGNHPNCGGGGGGGAGNGGNGGNGGTPTSCSGGVGGIGTYQGGVGGAGSNQATGSPGIVPGGGGGGAFTANLITGTPESGGPGAPGQLVITYTVPQPTITSVTGAGCIGSTITINGTGLAGATSVTIGGTAVTNLSISATVITGTIAAGTTSGTVSVTTPCGTVTHGTFTVNAIPAPVNLGTQNICAGGHYNFGGHVYTTAGTYADTTVSTITGCDSTTTVTLTIGTITPQLINQSICHGATYNFNGSNLSAAGTYTDTLHGAGAGGCDSIVILTLTVNPPVSAAINHAICSGSNYNFNGTILTAAGIYADTLLGGGAGGCDSIVILTLTINPPITSAFSHAICHGTSYNFNGTNLTAAGVYADTLVGAGTGGCDSIVVLTLSVAAQITAVVNDSICNGATYSFNGQTLTTAGTYADTLIGAGAGGCDSVVTLHLSLKSGSSLPVTVTSVPPVICANDSSQVCATAGFVSYAWNVSRTGSCFYTHNAGNYYVTATDVNGCTAVSNHVSVAVYAAQGISISVNGDTLTVYNANNIQWLLNGVIIPGATHHSYVTTQTGSYTVQVIDSNGCTVTSTPVSVTGITDIVRDEVSVYPNPLLSGGWHVVLSEKLAGSWCVLYDADGRLVYQAYLKNRQSEISPDVPRGIYFLQIHGAEMTYNLKLIKL